MDAFVVSQRLREAAVLPPDSGPLTAARMAKALRTRPSDRGQRPAEGPGLGNAALARAHAGRVQRKLAVSDVEDPSEREAEAFSARVVAQTALRRPVHSPDATVDVAAAARLAVVRRAGARRADSHPESTSFKAIERLEGDAGPAPVGPNSAGPVGAGPGTAGPEVTPSLENFITGVSGGDPLAEGLRDRIEPVLGADLSGVRVHTDDRSAAAAAQLQARAFTFGKDIFLGAGESPADLALMAHESTHVVQQGAVEVYRLFDFIGDAAKEAVADLAREIPGYDLLSQVAGQDLITGRPVRTGRAEFVQALLSHGPFAGAVGPVLQSLEALDQIFDLVRQRLAEHNLSLDRILRDMAAAWEEMDFTSLPGTNVAIAERYIKNLLTDVTGFVTAIVNDVIAAIKAAAIHFAEPLTLRPSVKPYWDLGVKIFHHNPLTGEDVDAATIDILRDLLKLLGKEETLQQMEQRGTLAETAKWLDEQFARFTALRGRAEQLVREVIDAISPDNLGNLVANLTSLADRAMALFTEFRAFAEEVIGKVLELVKKALLGWLAEHANRVPGFYLLTVILGRNPFTGDPVERNATNLIRGFITLLPNGEEVYRQLAESGTIASAAARIEGELARLNITWDLVTGTFKAIWDGLSLNDLLAPIAAFDRIVGQFGEPLSRILEFASTVLQVVIELILKLMNFPTELVGHIIDNAMAAIEDIKRDPIQFLKNVILALKEGVTHFLSNVANHLLHGLTDWLFRGLRGLGIQPPESLTLESIITLVIQVSGVTIEALWQKLGRRIGEERVALIRRSIDQLGQAWAFLKDIQERGITAVWEFIQGQLSNLWDTILNTAKDWIMREIIDKVTTRLISMLDPTGVMAVVNSAAAFFDAIRSAIEYIREILEIVDRYVSTIAAVARGDTGPGAAMLEQGLAQAVPVAIGFLANMLHLGDVPEKIREIIVDLRHLIDEAIDWLFDQAMALGQAALNALGLGSSEADESSSDDGSLSDANAVFDMNGEQHTISVAEVGGKFELMMASSPGVFVTRLANALNDPATPTAAKTELQQLRSEIENTYLEMSILGQYSKTQEKVAAPVLAPGSPPMRRRVYLQKLGVWIAGMTTKLHNIGSKYAIKDLINLGHRSKYVGPDGMLLPAYQEWRKHFYKGWLGGSGSADNYYFESLVDIAWESLKPQTPPGGPTPAKPSTFDVYYCEGCKTYYSNSGSYPGFTHTEFQLDHSPSVLDHFKSEGRAQTQEERRQWYNDGAHFTGLCSTCNANRNTNQERLQGDFRVKRRFRGANDNPPDPSDNDDSGDP